MNIASLASQILADLTLPRQRWVQPVLIGLISALKKAAVQGWAEKISGQRVRAVRVHGKNLFTETRALVPLFSCL